MYEKSKQYDFLKIIKGIGILVLFVVMTNLGICIFAISAISGETSKYADSVVLSYARELWQFLENVDSTMSTEIIYDDNLDDLQTQKEGLHIIQTLKATKNILVAFARQNALPVNYMIYFPLTDTAVSGSSTDEEYKEWRKIQKDLIEIVVENKAYTKESEINDWNIVNIQGKPYIIKYYHYKERYMCSWIEVDMLMNTMVAEELGKECLFVISSTRGAPYNNQERLKEEGITLPVSQGKKSFIREVVSSNLIINEPVEGTSFCLNAVILGYSEVAGAIKIQIVLMFIVGGIAVICLLFMLYIRKTVIQPIQDFSENIQKLRDDNTYTVETHYQISELKNASEILANLVDQIHGLKIDIYERTLEQQKIKMDFLSLQIEPHFFLNCLNIIYHMVEIK